MPGLLDPATLRSKFEKELGAHRRDALLFSVLTILLTPAFAAISVLVIFMTLYANTDGHGSRSLERMDLSPVSVLNILLIGMFAALFARPKAPWQGRARDIVWIGGAGVMAGVIVFLSYATSLSDSAPGFFWTVYGILALVVLGLLGHAYEPADDYYLGWYGMRDDPFTLRDDRDRSHMSLGFMVAVPRLIVGSYAAIFGSSWMIRGLDSGEIYGAASVLHALGGKRVEEAEQKLKFAGEESAARILRALDKMKFVRPDEGHLTLTSQGERFVGVSDVL